MSLLFEFISQSTYLLFIVTYYSLGGTVDSYPHPELDFRGFMAEVSKQNARTNKVWDPVTKRMRNWIHKRALYAKASANACTIL